MIDDGFLSLMLTDGSTKEDVKLPEGELGEKMQEEFDEGKDLLVTVVSAMGEEHALSCKFLKKEISKNSLSMAMKLASLTNFFFFLIFLSTVKEAPK